MSKSLSLVAVAALGAGLLFAGAPAIADGVVNAPRAALVEPVSTDRETAIFAGGCFWGVQGVFAHVKGVASATSGYSGGAASTAQYETVSGGDTGHAESVRVVFDPRVVNYADLLRIYFSVITDPTTLNAQGPDAGTQYRSALFPLSDAQAKVARAYLAQLSAGHVYAKPIVTRIETQRGFFPAEAYHQDFLARNPDYPYIVINDAPKVAALRKMFPQSWKS